MNNNIFIPKRINVGFTSRQGTYTDSLAYIIYWDNKGVLRKEKSWDGWRDKKIDPQAFDNEPIEGFVLNKKVGGGRGSWNNRDTYVRVFDPRGFEFEIDVANLLYILEHTSSIKGKGLVGKFVYGWSGNSLILIPEDAPDYQDLMGYADKMFSGEKFEFDNLVPGHTYLLSGNRKAVFAGYMDHYKRDSSVSLELDAPVIKSKRSKKCVFCFIDKLSKYKPEAWRDDVFVRYPRPKIKEIVIGVEDNTVHPSFADMMQVIYSSHEYIPVDQSKTTKKYITTVAEFKKLFTNSYDSNYMSSMLFFGKTGKIYKLERESYNCRREHIERLITNPAEFKISECYAMTPRYGNEPRIAYRNQETVKSFDSFIDEYKPYINQYFSTTGIKLSEGAHYEQ